MTQEEFLKEYEGKYIEVGGGNETAWMFEVCGADFSKGNNLFLGWIWAKRTILGTQGGIEIYKDNPRDEKIVLRHGDEIKVYATKEELEARVKEKLNTFFNYD